MGRTGKQYGARSEAPLSWAVLMLAMEWEAVFQLIRQESRGKVPDQAKSRQWFADLPVNTRDRVARRLLGIPARVVVEIASIEAYRR